MQTQGAWTLTHYLEQRMRSLWRACSTYNPTMNNCKAAFGWHVLFAWSHLIFIPLGPATQALHANNSHDRFMPPAHHCLAPSAHPFVLGWLRVGSATFLSASTFARQGRRDGRTDTPAHCCNPWSTGKHRAYNRPTRDLLTPSLEARECREPALWEGAVAALVRSSSTQGC